MYDQDAKPLKNNVQYLPDHQVAGAGTVVSELSRTQFASIFVSKSELMNYHRYSAG